MTDRRVIGPERSLGRITYPWSGLAVSLPVCALMGALTALAFAPYFVLPLVLVGFAAFALFIRHCGGSGSAFLIGWGFGFGQFLVGLRWISESFFVDADRFGALAWPAVLALSGFLALFPAFAAAATRYLGGRGPIAFLMFPGFWTLAEMARGVLFTGFPWNLTGYVWGFSNATLQPMSAIGVHGVGFLTVTICMVPLALAERYRLRPWAFAVTILVVPMIGAGFFWAFGAVRLANAETAGDAGLWIRVVQPNIPQDQKWDPDAATRHLQKLHDLSTSAASGRPRVVIWPETAYPYLYSDDVRFPEALLGSIPEDGLLLFGAVRASPGETAEVGGLLNSLLAVDHTGKVVADYDKIRLVPFGEFTPLKGFPGIAKLTAGDIDYVPGSDSSPLTLPALPPFRVLICYEAIFPSPKVNEERWLLNVTNDAWFGLSAGPYQHFLSARARSIESGLPMIRAANSGISAVVDGYGRIQQMLPLAVEGVFDTSLPSPIPQRTPYSKLGDMPTLIVVGILIAVGMTFRGKSQARRDELQADP
ncbi:apolipoprotein N-acyltransferase [Nitratireductor sp. L15S-10]|uniref:apolipoprotein N-acyltransferase n=1 Tax=Nitratireductor sp. L15S-10 TaxID=3034028 RepID=UPI003857E664